MNTTSSTRSARSSSASGPRPSATLTTTAS
jgi:hypothetical protein